MFNSKANLNNKKKFKKSNLVSTRNLRIRHRRQQETAKLVLHQPRSNQPPPEARQRGSAENPQSPPGTPAGTFRGSTAIGLVPVVRIQSERGI